MDIDLYVLGYKQFATTTEKCLRSLISQAQHIEASVYVLDNGSPDNSPELQKKFCEAYPQIHDLYSEKNLGYAGGMNFLASQGTGEWFILVGSDTIFYPHSLVRFKEALKKVPANVGIVGPVTNSAGTAQCIQSLGTTHQEVFDRAEQYFSQSTNLLLPLYRADFFCVAIRKTLWSQLGGLDLIYGLGYYEDFDFSMRAKQLGYSCLMVEDVFVFHQGSASFKGSLEQSQLLKRNKKIFKNKFPHAQMRHVRLDVYQTIQWILNLQLETCDQLHVDAISRHLQLRIESLAQNIPKGWIKKMTWKYRVQSLYKKYHDWQRQN